MDYHGLFAQGGKLFLDLLDPHSAGRFLLGFVKPGPCFGFLEVFLGFA